MSNRTLTAREVADLLRTHPRRVYQLIAAGELPAVRLGRSVRIPEEALRRRLGLEPMPGQQPLPLGPAS